MREMVREMMSEMTIPVASASASGERDNDLPPPKCRRIIGGSRRAGGAPPPPPSRDVAASSQTPTCPHATSWAGMCVRCGASTDVPPWIAYPDGGDDDEYESDENCGAVGNKVAVPVPVHSAPVKVGAEDARSYQERHTRALLKARKLVLVVDLDHTLLHTVTRLEMSRESPCHTAEVHHLLGGHLVTKLRPSVREFLEEARTMFELCVYTMGNREYADAVRNVLDPTGSLFTHVISRDDSTKDGVKDLDVMMVDKRVTLIVDDMCTVWPHHADRLFKIEPYRFFGASRGEAGDEDQQLPVCLDVLKSVHASYFRRLSPVMVADVARHLGAKRRGILAECVLFLTAFWSEGMSSSEAEEVTCLAMAMGAEVMMTAIGMCGDVGRITHLIVPPRNVVPYTATSNGTTKEVTPQWINECGKQWRIVPESSFAPPI